MSILGTIKGAAGAAAHGAGAAAHGLGTAAAGAAHAVAGAAAGAVQAAAGAAVQGTLLAVGNTAIAVTSGALAASMLTYSSFVIYDTAYTQNQAKSASAELLSYRPTVIDLQDVPLSASSLSLVNDDYRAWLTVDGTAIDYPVMQGENDLYYASHDVFKNASLTGAIYVSSGNSGDFTDSYNLIYGHHMDQNIMFGALDKYLQGNYLNGHRTGTIMTDTTVYDLLVFAVAKTDAYEREIYNVGDRMDEVTAFLDNPGDSTETVYYNADALRGVHQIVALSTCASATTNGRLVVFYGMWPRSAGSRGSDRSSSGSDRSRSRTSTSTGSLDYGPDGGPADGEPVDGQPVDGAPVDGQPVPVEPGDPGAPGEPGGPGTSGGPGTPGGPGGSPVDADGNPVDADGNPVDADGNPVVTDADGSPITDADGNPIPAGGGVPMGTDADGNPVVTDTDGSPVTDADGNPIPAGGVPVGTDADGNPVVTDADGGPNGTDRDGGLGITEEAPSLIEEFPDQLELLEIDDALTPLARFTSRFRPRGISYSGRVWALVNLIATILTVYLLLPVLHLRAKYGRIRTMKKINRFKGELHTAEELDERQTAERLMIRREAAAEKAREAGADDVEAAVQAAEAEDFAEVTQDDFAKAVEALYYHVKRYARRFRLCVVLEALLAAGAVYMAIHIIDFRLPMVLIDRWTPIMLTFLALTWVSDILLAQYRWKTAEPKKEERELAEMADAAAETDAETAQTVPAS